MVKYLEYKKAKLPVRLSYRALKALKGRDLTKLVTGGDQSSVLDDELFEDLLWAGLKSGHTYEEKEITLKREDMEDVLDECFFDFVKMIPEFFAKEKLDGSEGKKGNVQPNPAQTEDASPLMTGTV